jgi:hypothetical protein
MKFSQFSILWKVSVFNDETLLPQRSGNLPEKDGCWFLYPFRDKDSDDASPIIFLEEDKKPLQAVEE